jgi:starvation-inducible DNA-binding protein
VEEGRCARHAKTLRGALPPSSEGEAVLILSRLMARRSQRIGAIVIETERRKTIMKANQATQTAEKRHNVSDRATGLSRDAVEEISRELCQLLADVFALYVKTKNFHWHVSGAHFRDYHLLLDEQAEQIFAMTDEIAERARKIGGTTLHSISDISQHQRLTDNNKESVTAGDMLLELRNDNSQLARFLRATHEVCEKHNDVATASLIETWIDETERRTWFLSETVAGR